MTDLDERFGELPADLQEILAEQRVARRQEMLEWLAQTRALNDKLRPLPHHPDDDASTEGVCEPRRPLPPSLRATFAVPLPPELPPEP